MLNVTNFWRLFDKSEILFKLVSDEQKSPPIMLASMSYLPKWRHSLAEIASISMGNKNKKIGRI